MVMLSSLRAFSMAFLRKVCREPYRHVSDRVSKCLDLRRDIINVFSEFAGKHQVYAELPAVNDGSGGKGVVKADYHVAVFGGAGVEVDAGG